MHHPTRPIHWRDIAATYDPRGLPFLRFFLETERSARRPRSARRRP